MAGKIFRNGVAYGGGGSAIPDAVLQIKVGDERYDPVNGVADLSDTIPKTYSLEISDGDWNNGTATVSVVSSKINRYNYNVLKIDNRDVDDWLEFGVKGVSTTVTSVDGVAVLNTITFECDPNNIPDIDLSFNIVSHTHTGDNLTPLFFEDYGYADSELDSDSVYPVQNKAVAAEINKINAKVPDKIEVSCAKTKINGAIGEALDVEFLEVTFSGRNIWTDGNNIYYSSGSTQYILDKATSTWSTKTWSGLTSFSGKYIWTDGENVYYSDGSSQYVLDKATSTWSTKTWSGLISFDGQYMWTDGENIYYSSNLTHYILNKSTSTWSTKTWSGLTSFTADRIWTDGENIYCSSSSSSQYILNKSTSTWSTKTWSGTTSIEGQYIWTDGENIYYSSGSTQYILDKATSTWSTKTWSGLISFSATDIWTDGENVYYSNNSTHKKLIPKPKIKSTRLR